MGNLYRVNRNGTPTAGADFIVITSAANRRLRVKRIVSVGLGSTSAAQLLEAYRATGGTTPGTTITPLKAQHNDQVANSFTATQAWGTPPTADAEGEPVGWNAVGGGAINNVLPGTLEARNGEHICIRCPSGAPTPQACEVSVVVEED